MLLTSWSLCSHALLQGPCLGCLCGPCRMSPTAPASAPSAGARPGATPPCRPCGGGASGPRQGPLRARGGGAGVNASRRDTRACHGVHVETSAHVLRHLNWPPVNPISVIHSSHPMPIDDFVLPGITHADFSLDGGCLRPRGHAAILWPCPSDGDALIARGSCMLHWHACLFIGHVDVV